MKYDSLSRNTVKITLSEEDMREYSLCAESITLRTAETKRSLARLLKKMKLFTGCRPDRLFLEAFPKREGGCVLYVSSLGEDFGGYGDAVGYDKLSLMCDTESLDAMIKLCSGLKKILSEPDAGVYYSDGRYSIIVSTDSVYSEKLKHFLSEYGRVTRDICEIHAVTEYGRPLCAGNACQLFSKLF